MSGRRWVLSPRRLSMDRGSFTDFISDKSPQTQARYMREYERYQRERPHHPPIEYPKRAAPVPPPAPPRRDYILSESTLRKPEREFSQFIADKPPQTQARYMREYRRYAVENPEVQAPKPAIPRYRMVVRIESTTPRGERIEYYQSVTTKKRWFDGDDKKRLEAILQNDARARSSSVSIRRIEIMQQYDMLYGVRV